MSRIRFFLIFSCFLLACGKPQQAPVVSFYYWKTSINSGDFPDGHTTRFSPADAPLFLRLFDVDYSAGYGGAVPVGEVNLTYVSLHRPVVPVVYLVNRVFTRSSPAQIDSLAAKVARKIQTHLNDLGSNAWWKALDSADVSTRPLLEGKRDSFAQVWRDRFVPEIQIDCDWTAGTRSAYFRFLEAFKKQALLEGRPLSCTIRLHQFRDRKTSGIPPVQRGTLMCYNMASPKDTSVRNAIFDLALLKGYVENQPDYPLPLDVALPVFNWGAWFRSGEFRGLLSNWDARLLSDTSCFQSMGNNLYQLRIDTVWSGNYLREGDIVRLDASKDEEILAARPLLEPLFGPDSRLLIFDWDTTKIARYEKLVPALRTGW